MGRTRILVVGEVASRMAAGLAGEASLEHAPSAADALMRISAGAPPDLVVVSGDGDALELVLGCRQSAPETQVLVVASEASAAAAMEAVRGGAFDYLPASVGTEGLALAARRALRRRRAPGGRPARAPETAVPDPPGPVGGCPAMLDLYKTAARVAATEATVLLLGERSTGRELLARAIHAASPRAAGPFVPVDCATPEEALEARLFGEPAAPGAASRDGLLHAARGGTLYLEAVARLGRRGQERLLRALEEGLRPDGSAGRAPLDFRLVAASDEDLRALARRGRFREDLLYRLDVVALAVPPLRERREDIPHLARHFAARHAPGGRAEISPAALQALVAYGWPGNLREMESAIARAVSLAPVVLPEHLPPTVIAALSAGGADAPTPAPAPRTTPAPRPTPAPIAATVAREGALPTLAEMERRYAWEVLRGTGGNKTRAAEILGIDRKTLYRLLGEEGNGR
ncbi:MAG TPA: sigma 54-interacting transcriptional regulator [Anaeromyxobacteraceae bacterium]|nr:sigma 54-interacting transcriptional regulator [Anaeromyxobacteraceae bacterium]